MLPLGALVAILTVATVATAGGPTGRGASTLHLALFVAAGAAWGATVLVMPRLTARRWHLGFIIAAAIAMRVPAYVHAPAHSDDVWRYLWDGHVSRSGINPYRYAPDDEQLRVLRDDNWTRINHRELPSIYPPAAQLAFAAAPSLACWKLVVAVADLATLALLILWLRAAGRDQRIAVAWAWSPLVVVELGVNAHVDGLGVAALVAALYAAERQRHFIAGALLGASAAVKLLAAAVVPSTRSRRALLGFLVAAAVAVAPFAGAGDKVMGSLGEYGRRWRGNDGAFALIDVAAAGLVAHTRFATRAEVSTTVARLVAGRDRPQLYPDEVAAFLARIAVAALLLASLIWAWRRRASPSLTAEIVIGGILLFGPAVHPWYGIWMAPLVAVGARRAWLAMLVLLPLGYLPLDAYVATGVWSEPLWARLTEHGVTWVLLALGLICSPA